jgi:hypothetical protein
LHQFGAVDRVVVGQEKMVVGAAHQRESVFNRLFAVYVSLDAPHQKVAFVPHAVYGGYHHTAVDGFDYARGTVHNTENGDMVDGAVVESLGDVGNLVGFFGHMEYQVACFQLPPILQCGLRLNCCHESQEKEKMDESFHDETRMMINYHDVVTHLSIFFSAKKLIILVTTKYSS